MGLCSQYRWAFPSCEVMFAHTRAQALAVAQKERPAVAIMDLGLPPDPDGVSEGFATLDGLSRQVPGTRVIVATSHGDRTHALRAIAAGAYDFCEKPIDIGVLSTIVTRSLRLQTLENENRRASEMPAPSPIKNIVTADPGMLKVCRDIEKLAAANVWFSRTSRAVISFKDTHTIDLAEDFILCAPFTRSCLPRRAILVFLKLNQRYADSTTVTTAREVRENRKTTQTHSKTPATASNSQGVITGSFRQLF